MCVYTCQHDAEHEGREVVVEVEDTSHEVEREIVEGPANQQPQTIRRKHIQLSYTWRREERVGERGIRNLYKNKWES